MSVVALTNNPVFHAQTMHTEIDVHFVREKVLSRYVGVGYVPYADQTANIFIKALSSPQFSILRSKLGMCSTPSCLRQDVKED